MENYNLQFTAIELEILLLALTAEIAGPQSRQIMADIIIRKAGI